MANNHQLTPTPELSYIHLSEVEIMRVNNLSESQHRLGVTAANLAVRSAVEKEVTTG